MGGKAGKKLARQRRREDAVRQGGEVFDVLGLLRCEELQTKPGMARFLKDHVERISGNPTVKPVFFPEPEARFNKFLVKFMDDHELILDLTQSNRVPVYFSYGTRELDLSPADSALAREFFARLLDFGFIPDEGGVAAKVRGARFESKQPA